jgi:hypothetical protein
LGKGGVGATPSWETGEKKKFSSGNDLFSQALRAPKSWWLP